MLGVPLARAERIDDVERFVLSAASILGHAWARGLCHGDVSRENLLVLEDGTAGLVDWELSGEIGTPASWGTADHVPAWVGRHRRHLDPSFDTFALAAAVSSHLAAGGDKPGGEAQGAFLVRHPRSTGAVAGLFRAADAGRPYRVRSFPHSVQPKRVLRAAIASDLLNADLDAIDRDVFTRAWLGAKRAAAQTYDLIASVVRVTDICRPGDGTATSGLAIGRPVARSLRLRGRSDATGSISGLERRLRQAAAGIVNTTESSIDSALRGDGALVTRCGVVSRADLCSMLESGARTRPPRALTIREVLTQGDTSELRRAAILGARAARSAAFAGNVEIATRNCIRAHTAVRLGAVVRWVTMRRLADAWLRCARSDAAEIVYRNGGDPCDPDAVLFRIWVARHGPAHALAAWLSIARPSIQADAVPSVASALVAESRVDEARAVLRAERRRRHRLRRPATSDVALLESAGALLRATGRGHSAVRLLRCARRLAQERGRIDVALRASANLLQLQSPHLPPGRVAHEWASLASECEARGAIGDASRHRVREAAAAMAAGDCVRARRSLSLCMVARLGPRWRDVVLGVRLSAAYRDEDWPDVRQLLRQPPPWGSLAKRVRECVAFALADRHSAPSSTRWHALRARAKRRAVDAPLRVASLVRLFSRALARTSPFSPEAGTALRVAARLLGESPLSAAAAGLSKDCLSIALECDLDRAWTAIAAVRGVPIDRESLCKFADHWSNSASDRPMGVWRWEWEGTYALALLRTERKAPSAASLASLVRLVDGFARLGPGRNSQEADSFLTALVDEIESVPQGGERLSTTSLQAMAELHRTRDVEGLLTLIAESLRTVLNADRAVVLYGNETGDELAIVSDHTGTVRTLAESAECSESALSHARAGGPAAVFDDAMADAIIGTAASVRQYRPRSLMVAPLARRGDELGAVYVENRTQSHVFETSDRLLLELFSSNAALALDNASLFESTARSLATARRERASSSRAEALRIMGEVSAQVGHELNNLLAVIVGELEYSRTESQPERREASLALAHSAANDATRVVARMRSDELPIPDMEICELISTVESAVAIAMRARRGTESTVRLERTGTTSGPLSVRCAGVELREVVVNLVCNAIDASASGEVVVTTSGSAHPGHAQITVRDLGVGMTPDVLKRAFEPFFSTKGTRGTGLGLSLSRAMVESWGGALECDSSAGKGTTMTLTVPRVTGGVTPARAGCRPSRSSTP